MAQAKGRHSVTKGHRQESLKEELPTDDWWAELQKAGVKKAQRLDNRPAEAFSIKQLAERLGIGEAAARRRIRDMKADGIITLVGFGPSYDNSGLLCGYRTPYYRVVKEKKCPKRANRVSNAD